MDTTTRRTPRSPKHLVDRLPLRGPQFSTYSPDDVAWLLTDLTDVDLHRNPQAARRYYLDGVAAELRPATYQPSDAYLQLLAQDADRLAAATAEAIGVLTEAVVDRLGESAVLVSIMRAGVPVGALMSRWARTVRDVDLPHYAVSIVQDAGIDPNALRWIAHHHDPGNVIFVDGWTGKGTVAQTLDKCLGTVEARYGIRFPTTLAVLADPGQCVNLYGTRSDILIPSACLESAACGLVSRTVYHPELIGPTEFHGAIFHRDLKAIDSSAAFVAAVAAYFPEIATRLNACQPTMLSPDWAGRRAAERIAERYQVEHIDLVKPGVCETTRVLVQWRVNRLLVRRDIESDLGHVLFLASERGVPVEYVDDMPFSCVALVPPRPILATASPNRPYRDQ